MARRLFTGGRQHQATHEKPQKVADRLARSRRIPANRGRKLASSGQTRPGSLEEAPAPGGESDGPRVITPGRAPPGYTSRASDLHPKRQATPPSTGIIRPTSSGPPCPPRAATVLSLCSHGRALGHAPPLPPGEGPGHRRRDHLLPQMRSPSWT